ncbi:hypothetical protein An07g06250 [Aspergillus niger]|uniref:Uncharacterized protein n=2 Tax=Aspergillus niger TaxID=5061 RepID=E2PSU2_ASPNC|nr:hypothetical protein An07g06250 [Aspergillus niger]CAK48995.1 hypothetical protein An07g06250 [Aspergillus niger]
MFLATAELTGLELEVDCCPDEATEETKGTKSHGKDGAVPLYQERATHGTRLDGHARPTFRLYPPFSLAACPIVYFYVCLPQNPIPPVDAQHQLTAEKLFQPAKDMPRAHSYAQHDPHLAYFLAVGHEPIQSPNLAWSEGTFGLEGFVFGAAGAVFVLRENGRAFPDGGGRAEAGPYSPLALCSDDDHCHVRGSRCYHGPLVTVTRNHNKIIALKSGPFGPPGKIADHQHFAEQWGLQVVMGHQTLAPALGDYYNILYEIIVSSMQCSRCM